MSGTPSSLPRAALFDWDNTLVDTWPVIHDSMNVTLAAMGHPPWTIEQTRERVRRALREAFPEMFGADWEKARDIFYRRFREIHLERLAVRPGAEAVLAALAGKGVFLGVVSNKSGDHLRREAEHLGWTRFFGRLVGATDAERDKPAVDPVIMALENAGIRPGREVWFVGDTHLDMECAHRAGCVPILIREEPLNDGDFAVFPPEFHFSSCESLAGLVLTL